jgi:tight adherence protein B
MSPVVIILLVVVVAVIAIGGFLLLSRRRSAATGQRLYSTDRSATEFQAFGGDGASDLSAAAMISEGRRFLDPLNEALEQRAIGKKRRQQLSRANLKIKVVEYIGLQFLASVSGLLVSYIVLFPGSLVASILVAIIAFFIPRIWVGRRINKRLREFEEQLPDTLGLWVNAMRSGYSVLQAMEAISRDAPEPTKLEFHRVVQEVAIGIDLPDALEHLLERLPSEDLDIVVTAVNIQRETGGNLAEILETMQDTVRERIKLKGEIRVLTSQGRYTGWIISGLPLLLGLFLFVTQPSYMGRMFEVPICGWPMIAAALILIGLGTALIQKIVAIDV